MDNLFTNYNNTLTANPQSVGGDFANRYEGNYNGQVEITSVDVVTKEGPHKGNVVVHMTNAALKQRGLEIQDWFTGRKTADEKVWEQTQLNRIACIYKSAGIEFNNSTTLHDAGMRLLSGDLKGKTVKISQFKRDGFNRPSVSFKF